MFGLFKSRRRRKLRNQPFRSEWHEILAQNMPLYCHLPEEDRQELHGHIHVFLDEKVFEGCAGLEITDEIRVTIAGHACLLLLHRKPTYYPGLVTILVYPSAFLTRDEQHLAGGVVWDGEKVTLGEAWDRGVVVLSWDDVLSDAHTADDGHNVALHEFAHQLDVEDGAFDGAPVLEHRSHYVTWARVLQREYDRLRQEEQQGKQGLLDQYGATSPAEFFAVITEFFFERPHALQQHHPDLYSQLKQFYRQDPVELLSGS